MKNVRRVNMFCPRCKGEFRAGFTRCNECDVPLVYQFPTVPASAPELGPDTELIVVRTYNNRFDADIAKMTLEAAGIESMLRSEGSSAEGRYVPIVAFIELVVRSEDADDADEILSLDLPAKEV